MCGWMEVWFQFRIMNDPDPGLVKLIENIIVNDRLAPLISRNILITLEPLFFPIRKICIYRFFTIVFL